MTIKNGFSLVELLLSISIIAILTGSIIVCTETFKKNDISDNKIQFQTLISYVKAKSSIEGQKVQIIISYSNKIEVSSEKTNNIDINTDLILKDINENTSISVVNSEQPETPENQTNQSLTFYPDGTSDDAEIQLSQKDDTNSCMASLNKIGVLIWLKNDTNVEYKE